MRNGDTTYLTAVGKGDKPGWSLYQCVCGKQKMLIDNNVRKFYTRSCGCKRRELQITHGRSRTRLYDIWNGMCGRCKPGELGGREDYGGRGITVCRRWQGENGFANFLADMGDPPTAKHQIDRIDNDKGYWCGKAECHDCGWAGYESNCRWVTAKQNCRKRTSSVMVTHNGQTRCVTEWAELLGIEPGTLGLYIRRKGAEAAFAYYERKAQRR